MLALSVLYLICTLWLSVYGLNAYWLLWLYLKHRRPPEQPPPLSTVPAVTVQLPVYNERHVVGRAIDAVAALDWPRDRLQIQVLDDSTDETVALAKEWVDQYRRCGLDITHLHRRDRAGYKAGALNAALPHAAGEYVAIFDADFCPPPDFLQRIIPYLVADPGLAYVQARWGHLNDGYSLLTRAQSIALDGHFCIEHPARERAGLLSTFNGTGGVWRKESIEDTGGWDPAQLTEDVDLAYRAQLAGWCGMTAPHIVAPAELPAQVPAFRQQQSRWARGNTQCLLKLGWPLARARIPFPARLQGLVHLSSYMAHPLMLVVLLSTLPLIRSGLLDRWPLGILSLGTLGPPLLYALGQLELYDDWRRRLWALPTLICLGFGLALNSTAAILQTLLGSPGAFQRTPKFHLQDPPVRSSGLQPLSSPPPRAAGAGWGLRRRLQRTGAAPGSSYALPAGPLVWGEFALALYALLTLYAALQNGYAAIVPFLLLYVLGFGYIATLSLLHGTSRRTSRSRGPGVPA